MDYNPDDINAALARIEQRQVEYAIKINEVATKFDKMEERIGNLEKWRSWSIGTMAVIVFILIGLRDYLVNLVPHK